MNPTTTPQIDYAGLQYLVAQLDELTDKPRPLSQADKARERSLVTKISCVRSGMPLKDLQQQELNNLETRHGLKRTVFERADARATEVRAWRDYGLSVVEQRDSVVGNGHPDYYNGSTGSFVPRAFFDRVHAQMKWFDPLLDDSVITLITTDHGRPLQVGYYDDTANVASVVGENTDQSGNETDPGDVSATDLRAYTYRSPAYRFSIEALQDLQEMGTVLDRFEEFSASRMGLGVGRDLTIGNGSSKPLGLLTSLLTLSSVCQAGIITGDSESTGGAQTGANSIGISDLQVLYNSINQADLIQPKTAWLCNSSVRQYIGSILDKQGRPLKLIEYRDGREFLFGKPIYISPSMSNLGAGNIPIVFGNLANWVTRRAFDAQTRIKLLYQTTNVIERGEAALRLYERFDGSLLINGSSTTPGIRYLVNHS